jgi:hypothetical protein
MAPYAFSHSEAVSRPDDVWEEGQSGAPPSHFIHEKMLSTSCSRASSRDASKKFLSYLDVVYLDIGGNDNPLATLNASSLLLSPNCPFTAGNGMFDHQENMKKQHRSTLRA